MFTEVFNNLSKFIYKIIKRFYIESINIILKFLRFLFFFFSKIIFFLSVPILLILKNNKEKKSTNKKNLLIVRHQFANKKRTVSSAEFFLLDDIPSLDIYGYNKNPVIFFVDNKLPFLNLTRIALKIVLNDISFLVVGSVGQEIQYGLNIFSFKYLSKILKLPISSIWFDTCSKNNMKFLDNFQLDLNKQKSLMQTFALENPIYYPFKENRVLQKYANEKVIGAFTTLNPNRWKPEKNKDIDVLFIGQVGSYRYSRKKFINYIKKVEPQYSVFISILDRENFIPWEEYISLTRKAKIVVNFSGSSDCHQLKGRVFEAMHCGALVIDSIKSPISYYFEENKHFVSYKDEKDLLIKLNSLLSDPTRIKNISAEAKIYLQKKFSPEIWWKTILRI